MNEHIVTVLYRPNLSFELAMVIRPN